MYVACAIIIILTSCNTEKNPILKIEGGEIQGIKVETKGVYAYKGIPYAAAPVGENRWREPQSVAPWEGVKIADSFGPLLPRRNTHLTVFMAKNFSGRATLNSVRTVFS